MGLLHVRPEVQYFGDKNRTDANAAFFIPSVKKNHQSSWKNTKTSRMQTVTIVKMTFDMLKMRILSSTEPRQSDKCMQEHGIGHRTRHLHSAQDA